MDETKRLEPALFAEIVEHTPLVSIDLIVRNRRGEVLLGLRNNEPAKDCWFVPGGRICKDERIPAALERVAWDELGVQVGAAAARFVGLFEHHYAENFAERPGFGTHYVVLAFAVDLERETSELPQGQHRRYRWSTVEKLLEAVDVHHYTKQHFRGGLTVSGEGHAEDHQG